MRSNLSTVRVAALIVLLSMLAVLKAAHDTLRTPVLRHLEIELSGAPVASGERLKLILLADIHVAGPDMPPSRLARIVDQVNGLSPDMVLIAGDFVSDKRTGSRHYATAQALAPLAELQASHGVIAVPGNHDHWRDWPSIAEELKGHGITVLANEVAERGGLTIVGLDDDFTGHADSDLAESALLASNGQILVLSHSPDPFPDLPASSGLMLAGHTHCGQLAWPWGGSPATMSRYGQRYACGVMHENGNTLITSGGLGTSVLPFRLFTQPEIWVIELSAG